MLPSRGTLGFETCLLRLLLWPCCGLEDSVDLLERRGAGRMVCSCGSLSSICRGCLTVCKSPSKLSSQLSRTLVSSMEANCLSLSADSIPPKLSCGLRWGRWRALGEMEVAKSSSQLSSSATSGDRNWSGFGFGLLKDSDGLLLEGVEGFVRCESTAPVLAAAEAAAAAAPNLDMGWL